MKKYLLTATALLAFAIPAAQASAAGAGGLRVEGPVTTFGANPNDPVGSARYRENSSDTDPNQQREQRWSIQNMVGLFSGQTAQDGDRIGAVVVDVAGNFIDYDIALGEGAIAHGDAASLDLKSQDGDIVNNIDGEAVVVLFDDNMPTVVPLVNAPLVNGTTPVTTVGEDVVGFGTMGF